MRRISLALAIALAAAPGMPAVAAPAPEPTVAATTPWLIPPVDAVVARRFEAPGTIWGPGHRGIDYAVASGTAVRAVASGRIVFAGRVADTVAVTLQHDSGMRSTYTDLSEVLVAQNDVVDQGSWIGRAGVTHDGGSPGLHFGLKLEGAYVDPEGFFGPISVGRAIRLAPLVWEPPETFPEVFRTPMLSASSAPVCDEVEPSSGRAPAPNGNIAMLVAGIGSKTRGGFSASLYEAGGGLLGYDDGDTYRFSYRSADGPRHHEPYERADTFGDLRGAALELREQLSRIAREHPGRAVDLIAHSQGGIVARTYLAMVAEEWDPSLPRIDHLLTFATPHSGAPLASARPVLDETAGGSVLLGAASMWAQRGGPVPDPYSPAVVQLATGSDLLGALSRESALFGTKVMSLAIANDAVVPADHGTWDGYRATTVGPEGLNGHDAVVTSPAAIGAARGFLRDRPPACRTTWDLWGPRLGRAVSFAETAIPWLYRQLGP